MYRNYRSVVARSLGIVSVTFLCLFGARAQDTFASISSAFVEIKYQRGNPEKEIRNLLEFVRKDREAIINELGLQSEKKITVQVYNSIGQFRSEARVRESWQVAAYTRGALHVQPLEMLLKEGTLESTISYELAIAMLDDAWSLGCPPWLQKAYAVYHSGELDRLTPPIGVRYTSFADLDQDLQEYTKSTQRDDVHYVLGQTMILFIKRYGAAKSFGVFNAFDGNQTVEQVFENVFGEEYSVIETEWGANIRTESFPRKE